MPAGDGNSAHVRAMFARSDFMTALGVELVASGEGWCETALATRPEHRQQHGFTHAAVVFALADHTAGGAAGTTVSAELDVITVETKITFLRPATGDRLRCRGQVLRAGKRLVFAESEVRDGRDVLVAKLSSTLSVIPNKIS